MGQTFSNCIKALVHIIIVRRVPPGQFTLDSDADIPDTDGIFNLTWSSSDRADNYSIYIHNSTISEITGAETLLTEGIENRQYLIQGLPNSDYFFAVVAYNGSGSTISNSIQIQVTRPTQEVTISYGSYYLVFIVMSIVFLIVIQTRKQKTTID